MQAQAAYDTAQKHLESMKSVSHEAALKEAQGQLASAKGKYMGAQAQVSYWRFTAPSMSRYRPPAVLWRNSNFGYSSHHGHGYVSSAGQIHISQLLAQRLQVGDSASITVPGLDDPVSAKVALISPALDPGSTTVEVWLRIENKDGKLKVGTPVHAAIASKTIQNALKLPITAILTARRRQRAVMVLARTGPRIKSLWKLVFKMPEKCRSRTACHRAIL